MTVTQNCFNKNSFPHHQIFSIPIWLLPSERGGKKSQTGSPKKCQFIKQKRRSSPVIHFQLDFPSLTHFVHDWTIPRTHPCLALHRVNPSHSADLIKRHFPRETLSHPKVRWGSPFNLMRSFPSKHLSHFAFTLGWSFGQYLPSV